MIFRSNLWGPMDNNDDTSSYSEIACLQRLLLIIPVILDSLLILSCVTQLILRIVIIGYDRDQVVHGAKAVVTSNSRN